MANQFFLKDHKPTEVISRYILNLQIKLDNAVCDFDEGIAGYFTLYGDGAGDYAPLKDLTVTEVIELGKWLEIPDHLINKKPGDGLQDKGDEDRLGFKYADLDAYIREGKGTEEFKNKICTLYCKNSYKTDIVKIPGPGFGIYGNFVYFDVHCMRTYPIKEKK